DEDDRQDDNGAAAENVSVDAFVQNQPSEKYGDHGIDIGVSGHFRRGHVLEQPDIRAVADPGTAHHQVHHRAQAAPGPGYASEISIRHGEDEVSNSRGGHLPAGGTEDVHAGLPALGEH